MSEENRPFTVSTDVHMTVSRESLSHLNVLAPLLNYGTAAAAAAAASDECDYYYLLVQS